MRHNFSPRILYNNFQALFASRILFTRLLYLEEKKKKFIFIHNYFRWKNTSINTYIFFRVILLCRYSLRETHIIHVYKRLRFPTLFFFSNYSFSTTHTSYDSSQTKQRSKEHCFTIKNLYTYIYYITSIYCDKILYLNISHGYSSS